MKGTSQRISKGRREINGIVYATHQYVHAEWHYHNCHKKISDCQRDDEVICDRLQGPLAQHRKDDKNVAKERQKWKYYEDQSPVIVIGCNERNEIISN